MFIVLEWSMGICTWTGRWRIRMISWACFGFVSPTWGGLWDFVTRDFEVVMRTHGQVTFAPYVHGGNPRQDFFPGYRSDFFTYVDFFAWKGLVSNWLIANTTLIERPDSTVFRLDKIRYTLTPGYRYEFPSWILSGQLLHECIHTVSREEENGGSVWWNSIRMGAGTRGAHHLYLVDKYKRGGTGLWNSFDLALTFGAFLHGGHSVWLAQNHIYRYEEFGLIRYHLGRWGRWGLFGDVAQHMWLKANGSLEHKVSPTVNLFLVGRENIASLYYTYHAFDNNSHDNEDGLGLLGFKIVF